MTETWRPAWLPDPRPERDSPEVSLAPTAQRFRNAGFDIRVEKGCRRFLVSDGDELLGWVSGKSNDRTSTLRLLNRLAQREHSMDAAFYQPDEEELCRGGRGSSSRC